MTRAASDVPLGTAARTLLGTGTPCCASWGTHSDHNDPFWTQIRLGTALDRIQMADIASESW
ncbi:hypothetical protein [Mycobacterium leprae]|uniref:hypothetical protein n=1 Tax=Mycobacterium leprae TaxID=1769 RepID=UPI0002FFE89C|nr:hypothetical protein [Mycobacterium leprae]